jgi:hypothetical protein
VQQPAQTFNPAEVPINYTLNFQQVNLLLEGLGELPRKRTDGFYEQFRGVALQTLQAAEVAHKEAADKAAAAEAARLAPPEAAADTSVGGTD